ncbi:hypothetical protein [Dactylosporangium sp. CA-233914]|uniref:hypothetical protein n=1 Tax=Dactylosporangium sp. CA-233914 TaxID=3239934 RepID=UPI003D94ECB0
MDRDVFAARFAASAEAALGFGREIVAEELPVALAFRVRLNQSYDGHPPQPGEMRYPDDSARHRAAELSMCDAQTVVAELWRDGRVPEWINLAVVGETGTATVIEVVCCGRFTDDDTRLYHAQEGAPPFHVLGPVLPPGFDGTRFSIHRRAECWSPSEATHLATVADKVWSFDLRTDVFDEHLLAALPDLPNLEIFEHRACALAGNVISAFTRFPKLRVLRLNLSDPEHFRVSPGTSLPDTVTSLTIMNLPPRPWGHTALAETAPMLTSAGFSAPQTLWLDGVFSTHLRELTLTAADIGGSPRLPTHLDSLGIHLTRGTDEDVAALLENVTQLGSLSLRGTPVTDAIIPELERYELRRLDLVHTATTTGWPRGTG